MTENPGSQTPSSGSDADSIAESRPANDDGMAQHELDRMDVIRRFENGMYPDEDRIGNNPHPEQRRGETRSGTSTVTKLTLNGPRL
jgi:hypothetical protein